MLSEHVGALSKVLGVRVEDSASYLASLKWEGVGRGEGEVTPGSYQESEIASPVLVPWLIRVCGRFTYSEEMHRGEHTPFIMK